MNVLQPDTQRSFACIGEGIVAVSSGHDISSPPVSPTLSVVSRCLSPSPASPEKNNAWSGKRESMMQANGKLLVPSYKYL